MLKALRIGQGIDVHRLVSGRPFILGGVTIPSSTGLLGHSDADVLCHAVIDALLGAVGAGDIGGMFPDVGPEGERWRGADSLQMLRLAWGDIAARGFTLINLDATVLLEQPKLKPYISAMRKALASALGTEMGRVSVKAGTNERLGFIGREEGVLASAVVLLSQAADDGT